MYKKGRVDKERQGRCGYRRIKESKKIGFQVIHVKKVGTVNNSRRTEHLA